MGNSLMKDRICLITGANRGIGLALAKVLAGLGAQLILQGRNAKALEKVRKSLQYKEKHIIALADLRFREAIDKMANNLLEGLPRLDVLVHNAGLLGIREKVENYPERLWDEVMDVNLTAPRLLTVRLLPLLRKGNHPSVIFVTSGIGRRAQAQWGAYAVSKFGIEGLNQVMAKELEEDGIMVNAVNPGGTRTDMRAAAFPEEDPKTLPTGLDIAPLFVYLARPDITITGQSLEAKDWIGKDPLD